MLTLVAIGVQAVLLARKDWLIQLETIIVYPHGTCGDEWLVSRPLAFSIGGLLEVTIRLPDPNLWFLIQWFSC